MEAKITETQLEKNVATFFEKIKPHQDILAFAISRGKFFNPRFLTSLGERLAGIEQFVGANQEAGKKAMTRLCKNEAVWGVEDKELRSHHIDHFSSSIFDMDFHNFVESEKNKEEEKKQRKKAEKKQRKGNKVGYHLTTKESEVAVKKAFHNLPTTIPRRK